MLDLNHPRARYVFDAARIQDEIRMLLLQWQRAGTPPADLIERASKSIDALHELNALHFDDDKKSPARSNLSMLQSTRWIAPVVGLPSSRWQNVRAIILALGRYEWLISACASYRCGADWKSINKHVNVFAHI